MNVAKQGAIASGLAVKQEKIKQSRKKKDEEKRLLYITYRPYIQRSLDQENNEHYELGYN